MMNPLRWLAQLGLAGIAGLLMLGGVAWVSQTWLPAQRAQIDDIGSQARRVRHEMQTPVEVASSPDQAWQTLWQGLPQADQSVALQSAVLSAAKDHGLMVSAVQYDGSRMAWSAHEGHALWRQRMVMPLEGRYPDVQAWLMQILKEPALSIDKLSIERGDAMSDHVKANVSVSLWWRKPEVAHP